MKYKGNIILIGFMACGKTTAGKLLAQKLNMKFIDTDELIEKNEGITISEMFNLYGENYFRQIENKIVKSLEDKSNAVISTGGGIISNIQNINILKKNGKIIFLDTPLEKIKNRLKNNKSRPLNKDLQSINALYKKRHNLYVNTSDYILSSKGSPFEICNEIIKLISLEQSWHPLL